MTTNALYSANNRTKGRLREKASPSVITSIHSLDREDLCKVEFDRTPERVCYKEEDFYIRTGPGTTKLRTSQVVSYVWDHFRN